MEGDREFGPDTDAIRRWLEKRQTYQADGGRHRGAAARPDAVFVTGAPLPAHARAAGPDSRAAARSVLDALAADVAPEPAAPPPSDERPPDRGAAPAPAEGSSGRTTDVTFAPRRGARRALTLVLLVALAGAAGSGYLAATRPGPDTYAVAAVLGVVLLLVWAVRAGTPTTEVRIRRGRLEVRRGGGLEVVDLASPHTPVAMLGLPGHRGWKVLVERPDRPLLQVDGSLVEPHAFMDALLRMRPDLWEWAAENARELVGARRAG